MGRRLCPPWPQPSLALFVFLILAPRHPPQSLGHAPHHNPPPAPCPPARSPRPGQGAGGHIVHCPIRIINMDPPPHLVNRKRGCPSQAAQIHGADSIGFIAGQEARSSLDSHFFGDYRPPDAVASAGRVNAAGKCRTLCHTVCPKSRTSPSREARCPRSAAEGHAPARKTTEGKALGGPRNSGGLKRSGVRVPHALPRDVLSVHDAPLRPSQKEAIQRAPPHPAPDRSGNTTAHTR